MSTKHIGYFDSTRGLAALIVVFVHTITYTVFPEIDAGAYLHEGGWKMFLVYPPCSILLAGRAAVCLFFILSGYVLSVRYLGENDIKSKMIYEIVKRPIRLAGVVIFTTILGLLFCADSLAFIRAGQLLRQDDLFTFIFDYGRVVNGVLWTIPIELYGSFLTFGICFLIGNINKYFRMLLLIAVALDIKNTFYVAFVYGIIIADLHKNYKVEWYANYKNIIAGILVIPAVLLFSFPFNLPLAKQFMPNTTIVESGYVMLGAMLLFIVVCSSDIVQKILSLRPLTYIGEISYSLYAVHFILIVALVQPITAVLEKHLQKGSVFIAALVLTMALSFLFAHLIDRFIDKPCIKFAAWAAKQLVNENQEPVIAPACARLLTRIKRRKSPQISFSSKDAADTE